MSVGACVVEFMKRNNFFIGAAIKLGRAEGAPLVYKRPFLSLGVGVITHFFHVLFFV